MNLVFDLSYIKNPVSRIKMSSSKNLFGGCVLII